MTDMAPASAEKIREFVADGRDVLAIGSQPEALDGIGIQRFPAATHPPFTDHLDYLEQLQVPEAIRGELAPVLDKLRSVQPPELQLVTGDPAHIFFSHRKQGDVDWYWIVNDSGEERGVEMRFPARRSVRKVGCGNWRTNSDIERWCRQCLAAIRSLGRIFRRPVSAPVVLQPESGTATGKHCRRSPAIIGNLNPKPPSSEFHTRHRVMSRFGSRPSETRIDGGG